MFNQGSGRRWIATAMTLTLASTPVVAQRSGAAPATPVSAMARSVTYDAVIDGMSCRQHPSGRMDCEFRVGRSVRFVIAGVGQEDVVISIVQADSAGDYSASVVPLHGCVVVKPGRPSGADSVATFAYVSPRTGRVYHTWAACLTATRTESRAESKADTKAEITKAPATKAPTSDAKVAPVVKPPAERP